MVTPKILMGPPPTDRECSKVRICECLSLYIYIEREPRTYATRQFLFSFSLVQNGLIYCNNCGCGLFGHLLNLAESAIAENSDSDSDSDWSENSAIAIVSKRGNISTRFLAHM